MPSVSVRRASQRAASAWQGRTPRGGPRVGRKRFIHVRSGIGTDLRQGLEELRWIKAPGRGRRRLQRAAFRSTAMKLLLALTTECSRFAPMRRPRNTAARAGVQRWHT